MSKLIKQFIGFVFFVGPIALFWFIPWYWVVLYYNLYWTYTSYILYEANKDEKELSLLYCISLPLLFNFFGFLVVILTESKSKKVNEESSANNSSDNIKTEKSSYQKAIDLEIKKMKERIGKVDFSVSEEEFRAEPIKTLYKLSKELSKEEYLKKAKQIWKEYIIGRYNKFKDIDKDLFFIDVQNLRDDHYRLEPRFRVISHDEVTSSIDSDYVYQDSYWDEDFFEGYQIAHIYDQDNKPGEPCLVFFANSSWGGNYTEEEFDDMEGWAMYGDVGVISNQNILDIDDIDDPKTYEDVKKFFFSFDQICEYLAKCPIYDYKEALEAGALGEDIDFRSFDISKMEKKKIDLKDEQSLDRKARVDFSVSEEDFKVEPIKTLYKLSKELNKEEYLKKAKQIWEEYLKEEIEIQKYYHEFYETLNLKKDLFWIELEYKDDNYKRIQNVVRILSYKSIEKNNFFMDEDDILDFTRHGNSHEFNIANGCHLSYADTTKLNKPIEERLIFLYNSDWEGDYIARSDSILEHFEDIGWDYDAEPFNTYEDWKKAFFSFDQLCEYLAKCKIYDYKEALEAGALGEDIDFRSFDISKMENSTYS